VTGFHGKLVKTDASGVPLAVVGELAGPDQDAEVVRRVAAGARGVAEFQEPGILLALGFVEINQDLVMSRSPCTNAPKRARSSRRPRRRARKNSRAFLSWMLTVMLRYPGLLGLPCALPSGGRVPPQGYVRWIGEAALPR